MTRPISKRVSFTTTEQTVKYVDALQRTGLFGATRAEVLERLVHAQLRALVDQGWMRGAGKSDG